MPSALRSIHTTLRSMLGALRSILYIQFNLFPVKEFDGEIHHRHHLLTTVALTAEPNYHQDVEQPKIFSDGKEEPFIRAWPDQDIPRRQGLAPAIHESAKEALVQDLLLQHSTKFCLGWELTHVRCTKEALPLESLPE